MWEFFRPQTCQLTFSATEKPGILLQLQSPFSSETQFVNAAGGWQSSVPGTSPDPTVAQAEMAGRLEKTAGRDWAASSSK